MDISQELVAYTNDKTKPSHGYEGVQLSKNYATQVLSSLNLTDHSVVLDLASGKGDEADFIEKHFHCKVIRTDISHAGLSLQKDSSAKFVSSADALALKNNSVDFIHIKDAAVHFPKLENVFREAERVLRVGGSLLIATGVVPDNFAQIYFGFESEKDLRLSKKKVFSTVEEYLEIVKNPQKYLQMGNVFASVSPPYFKINREIIIEVAKKFHFEVIKDEIWILDSSEKNTWNQGNRVVLQFRKISDNPPG